MAFKDSKGNILVSYRDKNNQANATLVDEQGGLYDYTEVMDGHELASGEDFKQGIIFHTPGLRFVEVAPRNAVQKNTEVQGPRQMLELDSQTIFLGHSTLLSSNKGEWKKKDYSDSCLRAAWLEAMPNDDQQSSEELDFRAVNRRFSGTINYVRNPEIALTCECAAPYEIGNYFDGTGWVTHMGNATSESIPCIEYILSGPNIIGYYIDSQCQTFVAENGDELFGETASYSMYLDFQCFCKFTGSTTVTFYGGTGKFENATGSAKVTVVNDLVTDVVTVKMTGKLKF
ncbi:MAG: hypothetical protein IPJ40_13160 [Saprospirales bacterium]|nr:hypothetical protein [Saprospirales bacterium]